VMGIRERALQRAIGEIGVTENPPGSNNQKYGTWYGLGGQPWCSCFITWLFVNEGSTSFVQGSRWAYVPYLSNDARAGKYGLKTVGLKDGQPGDVVTFDWEMNGEEDHVGIIEKNHGGGAYTVVEGNVDSRVARHSRDLSTIKTIIRHPDDGESEDDMPDYLGLSRPALTVPDGDGVWVDWRGEQADPGKFHTDDAAAIKVGGKTVSITVEVETDDAMLIHFCEVTDGKITSADKHKVAGGRAVVTNAMKLAKDANLKIRFVATTGKVKVDSASLRGLIFG
jgi:CHAP domain